MQSKICEPPAPMSLPLLQCRSNLQAVLLANHELSSTSHDDATSQTLQAAESGYLCLPHQTGLPSNIPMSSCLCS